MEGVFLALTPELQLDQPQYYCDLHSLDQTATKAVEAICAESSHLCSPTHYIHHQC